MKNISWARVALVLIVLASGAGIFGGLVMGGLTAGWTSMVWMLSALAWAKALQQSVLALETLGAHQMAAIAARMAALVMLEYERERLDLCRTGNDDGARLMRDISAALREKAN